MARSHASPSAVARRGEWRAAAELPVARVAVEVALAHLDRPFDYRVPEHLDEIAMPGVRLRVRFAGRLVDGYLLERVAESGHPGTLAWVEKVVSAEPALTAEVAALCRSVADRYAGVLADVLRLAVPPRHARVEAEPDGAGEPALPAAPGPGTGWSRYPRGTALLDALTAGRAAHAVWQALPGESWADRLAEAAAAAAIAGRGALLVVPDQCDVDALHAACVALLGVGAVVALTAELGPAERYRRWLAVRRGRVRVVVGTRSAAFAPVARPGLLAVWDDGDDLHSEPRAPYPHVRDVLVLRAHATGAALLVGGFARTAEGQSLVDSGWARAVVAERGTVRAAMPRITAPAQTEGQLARDPDARAARLPASAFEAVRAALAAGHPALVQVPRAGYLPWLSCGSCRDTARCRHCAGPLGLRGRPTVPQGEQRQVGQPRPTGQPPEAVQREAGPPKDGHREAGPSQGGRREAGPLQGGHGEAVHRAAGPSQGGHGEAVHREAGPSQDGHGEIGPWPNAALPQCRWCGRVEGTFRCPACGSRRLRAGVVGSGRTAEELGRAFPGTTIRSSGGGAPVLGMVAARPEIVVATPGAEPRAAGGFGAALLLDGWALLARPDLRVAEETLRRWLGAAALVRPHTDGGRVLVMADPALPVVQALLRWDPAWHAAAELAGRIEVGFPPAVRMAAVDGSPAAVAEVLAGLPAAVEVLGPVELDPADSASAGEIRERALLRVPRAQGRALAVALHAVQAARAARKAADPVRVRLDPSAIG